jgi:hypothetical protein
MLKDIITQLKNESKIIVTGPQRSGTTFTAKMLAKELGYKHIDEMEFSAHNEERWRDIISTEDNFVMQCPAMARYADDVDCFVVFMDRNLDDIKASQDRIGWTADEEPIEKKRYPEYSNMPIAEIKYDYFKKNLPKKYILFKYEWLKEHPDYIEKDKRKGFKPKQTQ